MKVQILQLFEYSMPNISVEEMLLRVLAASVFGLAIYLSYWISHAGTIYSQKFIINLITLTILTGMVMTVIGDNLALSLGMVGALSIVRFRTAIKDPLDLLYLFWAITTGITVGAGLYLLSLCAAGIMLLLVLLFQRRRNDKRVYIVVIHYDTDAAGDDIVRAFGRMRYAIKSKTLRAQTAEMAVEVFCRANDVGFMERLRAVSGVQDVTLVQYIGEYHG